MDIWWGLNLDLKRGGLSDSYRESCRTMTQTTRDSRATSTLNSQLPYLKLFKRFIKQLILWELYMQDMNTLPTTKLNLQLGCLWENFELDTKKNEALVKCVAPECKQRTLAIFTVKNMNKTLNTNSHQNALLRLHLTLSCDTFEHLPHISYITSWNEASPQLVIPFLC